MQPIPTVPGLPFVGNANDVDPNDLPSSLARLATKYGPCYRVWLSGKPTVVVSSVELLSAICDEKRFGKVGFVVTDSLRTGLGAGLVTAFTHEEDWGVAHRVLAPKFSPIAMGRMFPELHELACQLVSKWARDPERAIDPTDDFTRLTLDSISLCAMGVRFNSFYKETLHPFVGAMSHFLSESAQRAIRPHFVNEYVYRNVNRQYYQSIDTMKAVAQAAINNRRAHPTDKPDLLNGMLSGTDPKTGKGMSDASIINNALTFLIAGHETTSGMLSFLFVELLQHPEALRRAQEEVDRVLGIGPITHDHLGKLPYITACLRETLRLWPTVAMFQRGPIGEGPFPVSVGNESWQVNKEDRFIALLRECHRDPAVYGDSARDFKPERMLEENFMRLPQGSWQPFGAGQRACIGRNFALDEARIITALLLQNFIIQADDPSYQMQIKNTLTVKPANYSMHAVLRPGLDPISLEQRLWGGNTPTQKVKATANVDDLNVGKTTSKETKPLTILFGSNTGTCEALAEQLATAASSRGYSAAVKWMDHGIEDMTKDTPVVIVTASFEGEPPDNAARFMEWLQNSSEPLKNKFAVYGCGNREWTSTYQRIPTLCDELLSKRGGTRIAPLTSSNVAEGTFFDEFDAWANEKFWPAMGSSSDDNAASQFDLDVEIRSGSRAVDLRQDMGEGVVLENTLLTGEGEPLKKHIEIQLPPGMEYTAGDYLSVLPINSAAAVKQIMAHFKVPWDARILIKDGQHTALPAGRDTSVFGLLSFYVELNQPCTQNVIAALAAFTKDAAERKAIETLTAAEINEKRMSIWNILESYASCELPFGSYLAMLKPLRVRQYSISSSPLASPTTCTLTYGVLNAEAKVGGGKRYLGIASNYLSELRPGDKMLVSVRKSNQAFGTPELVETTPIIMACAGTGLAPFHGFVQERVHQISRGRKLAPALLFIGCRHPDRDALYATQLQEWAELGAVDVRYAFSKAEDQSYGCKHVQDRLWRDRDEIRQVWRDGAKLYVCGSGRVADAVKKFFVDTSLEGQRAAGRHVSREQVEREFEKLRNVRYASDVFN